MLEEMGSFTIKGGHLANTVRVTLRNGVLNTSYLSIVGELDCLDPIAHESLLKTLGMEGVQKDILKLHPRTAAAFYDAADVLARRLGCDAIVRIEGLRENSGLKESGYSTQATSGMLPAPAPG